MELSAYVDAIQRQLTVAAAAGGDDARELAERLIAPLDSAVRLALLDALSEAAMEITRDLAPGSVDLRLRNREPTFVVTPPPPDLWADEVDAPVTPPPPPPPPSADGEDEATVRISLRLPEPLKVRVEQAAARTGVSINTWLIRAASVAVAADDHGPRTEHFPPSGPAARGSQRFTGWVR
jgi:hypothetical protein